jgi:glycosyltransferase involved in cell wall biosynthesis
MRIRLIGKRNDLGIGIHYANFADAIVKIQGIGELIDEIDFTDHARMEQAIQDSRPGDVNISFLAANIHEFFKGYNIQWVVFESTRVPEHIMSVLRPADQVWVPSTWGREILIGNGIPEQKICVVPEGVNGHLFHTHLRTEWEQTRPFRFLSVGKYEQRKSFDETLLAFSQTFGNTDGIELVIKSNYFTNHEQKAQDLQKKIKDLNLTNVTVLWGQMSVDQIAELYRSCDAFVFPTKGEGWGLPLIEAAASGLPIITVPHSGHTEFIQHMASSVVGVGYVMTDIDCPEYQSYYPDINRNWGQWARPDIYSISNAFQTVCREYKTLYKNAQKNSTIIRNRFSWQNSVDRALVAIRSIAQIKP